MDKPKKNKGTKQPAKRRKRMVRAKTCVSCGVYIAEPPSFVCEGCEAYREHQQ